MCGICGIVHFDVEEKVLPASIKKMQRSMAHRGPDGQGEFFAKNIGLGHVRLSIIDLSTLGRQPMTDESGALVIVYNGEIYNYLELRAILESKYRFRSQTDTEVLLYAYREWGEDCLHRLNGMFAFAIYDVAKQSLFIARDRFGIKPLYYYCDQNQFVFASEIPPILQVVQKRFEPNEQMVFDYLAYNRTNHTDETFFKGIKKLQHSHKIRVEQSGVKISRWYNLKEQLNTPFATPDELRESLIDSIRLQLRSDVPIGVCLSGGLDSSAIASLVIHHFKKSDLYTYSAIYGEDKGGDEYRFIKQYAPLLQGMKFTTPSANSLLDDLDEFVKTLAEPVPNSSEYAEFKVMQLAKGFSTVLLNGQGVDEAMAGYLYFMGYYYRELLASGRIGRFMKELCMDVKYHQSWVGPSSLLFFLAPASIKRKVILRNKPYLEPSILNRVQDSNEILSRLYNSPTIKEALIDHFEYKFEHHLLWADKSGMRFSLETRFPFLDHRLVEKAIPLEPEKQIKNGWMKIFLREAVKGIVPEEIRLRKVKVGYETPEADWFKEEKYRKLINHTLNSPTLLSRGYINAQGAKNLYQQYLNGNNGVSSEIWKWINLERWLYHFFDSPQNSNLISEIELSSGNSTILTSKN